MKNTVEVIEKIKSNAKPMQQIRETPNIQVGQVVRQGDIYIERIAAIEGKGKAIASRQLTPGNSKGSRHVVNEAPGVTIWESAPTLNGKFQFQVGPAIEAKDAFTVSHPEHAFCKLPAGTYQVYFQADAHRMERARD